MRALIRDYGQQASEFVDVLNADGTRRFIVRPFGSLSVRHALLHEGKLFCVSHSQNSYQKPVLTKVAVFDVETGALTAETQFDFIVHRASILQ